MSSNSVVAPPVKFATVCYAEDFGEFVEWVRAADGFGFDAIGYGDSQNLWGDLFVALTLAAEHTSRARIGPMVTNPMTRHPAVAAGGMASVQQISGGRAFFGLGTGDSALRNIGRAPPPSPSSPPTAKRSGRSAPAGRPNGTADRSA